MEAQVHMHDVLYEMYMAAPNVICGWSHEYGLAPVMGRPYCCNGVAVVRVGSIPTQSTNDVRGLLSMLAIMNLPLLPPWCDLQCHPPVVVTPKLHEDTIRWFTSGFV